MFRPVALMLSLVAALPVRAQGPEALVVPLPKASTYRKETRTFSAPSGKALKLDLYRPKSAKGPLPVAIFLNGIGAEWLRTHPQYSGWASLVTAHGFAGVAMDSDPASITGSYQALLGHLRENASALGLDANRVVLWSCSSNAQAGMAISQDPTRTELIASVVYYGYGPLTQGRVELPVLVVRAGLDSPELNRALDENVRTLLSSNAPVTVINASGLRHAFDLFDPNEESRSVIARTLAFMREALDPKVVAARRAALPHAEAAGAVASGRWADAISRLQAIATAEPKNADVQQKLGAAYASSGDHRAALERYGAALELGNRNVGMISYAAARSAMALSEPETALKWLEKVRQIPPIRERVKADEAFAPLRSHPKYLELFGPA